MGRVTGIFFSLDDEWVLSVGRDKSFQWHESKNGKKYSEYQTQAWCTSLEYPNLWSYFVSELNICVFFCRFILDSLRFDVQTKHVFVGDYSGLISVLRLENKMIKLKTTLKGHSGKTTIQFYVQFFFRLLIFFLMQLDI